jgi:tetratricopeptide (TPR) repeat protein
MSQRCPSLPLNSSLPGYLAAACLVLAWSVLTSEPARAQQPTGLAARGIPTETFATLLVSVRGIGGGPISGNAIVNISSNFPTMRLSAPTQDGGTATFTNVKTGDYDVEVKSVGYQTTTERASLFAAHSTYTVYVYLHREGEVVPATPPGKPVVSPHLQSEIDKGLDKMRRQQYDAAQTHFDKAAKLAPANPDVQYLLGLLAYMQQHFDVARTKFEAALSIYPTHERALVSLGELQLRAGQPDQAAQTLEKAYAVNGADWRTHYLLAYAYSGQKQYDKAQSHAERAAELAKDHAAPARFLLGRVLVAEGKREGAKTVFAGLLRDFPNEATAKDAKAALADLEKPVPVAVVAVSSPEPAAPQPTVPAPPPVPAAAVRPWAPPDVDAREYSLATDVACSQEEVLQRTELRTKTQLANLEKFSATEHIEHQEIDAYGNPGPARDTDFAYLVFVNRPRKGSLFLDEERNGGQNLGAFPTALASRGLVGLGVFLFSPEYERDLVYKCEGLGEWRGQAAWLIRFEQRKDVPSRVMTWRNNHGLFPVALKGRVWVTANTYDVVHIESDLREPIPDLELTRDHLMIDYGPVNFEHGKTSLWLPWHAELYLQLHGKRYHHRHTLTNYTLFSVDTDHQISAPKGAASNN